MSSEYAIEVDGLGKCYQVYEEPYQRLLQMFTGRLGRNLYKEFWALKDVSFKVQKGQVYGVLGKNGAGKSTLLQIICGTLTPTTGELRVHGRVAALLELGSGFNPDFSGVENVYMNAQLLGLRREQVDEKLDDILAFADIGDFVYQPVKTYSSGMFARLAFSVAIHVEPDILIVDEALSVGDAWFQHKSMARMRKLMESGCTVIFVSHSIDAVRALCDQAIWLDKGAVKITGDVTEITNAYMNDVFVEHNKIILNDQNEVHQEVNDDPQMADHVVSVTGGVVDLLPVIDGGDVFDLPEPCIDIDWSEPVDGSVLRLAALRLFNSNGIETTKIEQGEKFTIEASVQFFADLQNISVGILIKDQYGQDLTGESIFNTFRKGVSVKKGQLLRVSFSSQMLLRGGQSYSMAVRLNQVANWDRSDNVTIYADELAMVFDVIANLHEPMWFKFKLPFMVSYK